MASLEKIALRHLALDRRAEQWNKDELSLAISKRLSTVPGFEPLSSLLIYISVRTEVRTWPIIEQRLQRKEPVFIPYCQGNELKIFRLASAEQLCRGSYGILEPTPALCGQPEFHTSIDEITMVLVPGVAFDRQGHRLGYGKGYFDRMLAQAPANLIKVGLAFECQLFDHIPVDDHDITMDFVVTESSLIKVC